MSKDETTKEATTPQVPEGIAANPCPNESGEEVKTPECQQGKECPTPTRECPECAKDYLAAPAVDLQGNIERLKEELVFVQGHNAVIKAFIMSLVNDPFALTPMAKVRAQEFLARI